jgi:hypothetical protein
VFKNPVFESSFFIRLSKIPCMVNYVSLMLVMDLGIILFMLIALIDSWNEKENRPVMISARAQPLHEPTPATRAHPKTNTYGS